MLLMSSMIMCGVVDNTAASAVAEVVLAGAATDAVDDATDLASEEND